MRFPSVTASYNVLQPTAYSVRSYAAPAFGNG